MSIPPKPKNVIEKESEIFEITNNNIRNWNLTEDEKSIYGDRIIENYDKLDLLGKYLLHSLN